jgi:hypothetical protein
MNKPGYSILLICLFLPLATICYLSCKPSDPNESGFVDSGNLSVRCKPLLSSRIKNLDQLKTIVSIKYDRDYSGLDSIACQNSKVNLTYVSNGEQITRTMSSGISQNELSNLSSADFESQLRFVLLNPDIIRQRRELEKAYNLSRRRAYMFGPGDMAFYDIAEALIQHINTPGLAFQCPKDTSEDGYINTFNHLTSMAIMTSFFSEELADLIADLHERFNMPEITCGRFSEKQLIDSMENPVDNYVDIINNEIGQKIGRILKVKYKLHDKTECTPFLLAAYLNDIQSYYMLTMEIGLDNFRPTDEVVIKMSNKINKLLNGPRIIFR